MRSLVLICALALSASAQPPNLRLPDVSAGVDGIARTLVSAFDQVDIVALGEAHESKPDSDLRIALVRSPDFATKVRFVVVEFGSTTEQSTLDRYIRGENVPPAAMEQVCKSTTQGPNGLCDSPVYLEFFKAVRDVNAKLPVEKRIRVLGGDPGPGDNRSREVAAADIVKEQVLEKHGKALVIYGAAHFYRSQSLFPPDYLSHLGEDAVGLIARLEKEDPGRVLSVIRIGWLDRPSAVAVDIAPDFRKFDRAIKTSARPVLLSLKQPPFRDFTVEEFLGRTLTTCWGGCRSVFKGSTLTLGQLADACVYFGGDVDADAKVKAGR